MHVASEMPARGGVHMHWLIDLLAWFGIGDPESWGPYVDPDGESWGPLIEPSGIWGPAIEPSGNC